MARPKAIASAQAAERKLKTFEGIEDAAAAKKALETIATSTL